MDFIYFIELLSGLGVFLLGVKSMSSTLLKAGGGRVKQLLARYSSRPLRGVLTGAGATAALSSSSALTAIVVGLVDAGTLSLTEASYLIMGANIGTTISGLIVAAQGLEISSFFPLFALIGLILSACAKKPALKTLGAVLSGLGLMFSGLGIMSAAAKTLVEQSPLAIIITKSSNIVLLVFIGCISAASVQSSSAINGILITLVNSGGSLSAAVYIVLGTNIGSCATTLLCSGTMGTQAKRASFIHLYFNAAGTLLFMLILSMIPRGSLETLLLSAGKNAGLSLALFNLVQNIITTLVVLPFNRHLVGLSLKSLPKNSAI